MFLSLARQDDPKEISPRNQVPEMTAEFLEVEGLSQGPRFGIVSSDVQVSPNTVRTEQLELALMFSRMGPSGE